MLLALRAQGERVRERLGWGCDGLGVVLRCEEPKPTKREAGTGAESRSLHGDSVVELERVFDLLHFIVHRRIQVIDAGSDGWCCPCVVDKNNIVVTCGRVAVRVGVRCLTALVVLGKELCVHDGVVAQWW